MVIWHVGRAATRDHTATRLAFKLIAIAFFALALFLFITSVRSLILGLQPGESPLGIAYLALTAAVMFALAAIKRRTARAMDSGPLEAEASMTYLDGWLASASSPPWSATSLGRWWADALATGRSVCCDPKPSATKCGFSPSSATKTTPNDVMIARCVDHGTC